MSDSAALPKPEVKDEIRLTERAARQVLKIKAENNLPESSALRIGVKGGGCSGLSYVLGFDAETKPTDLHFEQHGVKMTVDPKSMFFLSGTQLDYEDGLNGKGFVFNNPKAVRTCGCGNSFSA